MQKQTNNQFSGYHLFNLGSSYQFNDRVRINAAVNNLLDKNFTEYMDYYDLNADLQKHISTFLSVLLCLERLFLGTTTAVYSLTIFNI
nr:TonB-dependent receptor [Acinetobacter sp. ANC 4173]